MNLREQVLVLNAEWKAISITTLEEALSDLHAKTPKKAVKIEYYRDPHTGEYDFNRVIEVQALTWDEWLQINPREFDKTTIRTPKLNLRMPTVIYTAGRRPKKHKGRVKRIACSKRAVYNHYSGICAYTGEFIPFKDATRDHVIPKSRGGSNDWLNIVLTSKSLNVFKGSRTPSEAGLQLRVQPSEPNPHALRFPIRHPDWKWFIAPTFSKN